MTMYLCRAGHFLLKTLGFEKAQRETALNRIVRYNITI